MKEILVETSARHVHVTQETLEVLFGEGYQLTVKKMLSQPGQFASNEKDGISIDCFCASSEICFARRILSTE